MSANIGQSVRLATKYTPWTVYLSPSSAKYGWFQGKGNPRLKKWKSRGNRSATGRALTGSEARFASIKQVPFIFAEAYVQANL